MRPRLSCRARARPIYEERRAVTRHPWVKGSKQDGNAPDHATTTIPFARLPVAHAYARIDAQDRSEMTEEQPEECPTPPAGIGHEFQEPIVEELPRQTPAPPGEPSDAAQGDSSDNKNGVDH
jgi:hypothetical protein